MNIIDFFKEFEFIKRRRLRSLGGAKICSGGCEYMLRGVRPDRGAPLKPPLDLTIANTPDVVGQAGESLPPFA